MVFTVQYLVQTAESDRQWQSEGNLNEQNEEIQNMKEISWNDGKRTNAQTLTYGVLVLKSKVFDEKIALSFLLFAFYIEKLAISGWSNNNNKNGLNDEQSTAKRWVVSLFSLME